MPGSEIRVSATCLTMKILVCLFWSGFSHVVSFGGPVGPGLELFAPLQLRVALSA